MQRVAQRGVDILRSLGDRLTPGGAAAAAAAAPPPGGDDERPEDTAMVVTYAMNVIYVKNGKGNAAREANHLAAIAFPSSPASYATFTTGVPGMRPPLIRSHDGYWARVTPTGALLSRRFCCCFLGERRASAWCMSRHGCGRPRSSGCRPARSGLFAFLGHVRALFASGCCPNPNRTATPRSPPPCLPLAEHADSPAPPVATGASEADGEVAFLYGGVLTHREVRARPQSQPPPAPLALEAAAALVKMTPDEAAAGVGDALRVPVMRSAAGVRNAAAALAASYGAAAVVLTQSPAEALAQLQAEPAIVRAVRCPPLQLATTVGPVKFGKQRLNNVMAFDHVRLQNDQIVGNTG